MENLVIIDTSKTFNKYNGKEAVRCKFLKTSDKKILQQTININSTKWRNLLKKSSCNASGKDIDCLIGELEGKQFIAEVYQGLNSKKQKWDYIRL